MKSSQYGYGRPGYPVRGVLGPVQACDIPILSGVVKVVSEEIVGETEDI